MASERKITGGQIPAQLAALQQLERLFGEGSPDMALGARQLQPDQRPLYRELLAGVLRRLPVLVRAASRISGKRPNQMDARTRGILCLALYRLLVLEHPAGLVVDQANRLASARARGFINAVLRKFVRSGQQWSDFMLAVDVHSREHLRDNLGFPEWLIDAAGSDADLAARLESLNRQHPLWVHRQGELRRSRNLACELDSGWSVTSPGGWLAVQALHVEAGHDVLDMAAAPGTKTLMIQQLAGPELLLGLDRSAKRLRRMIPEAQRLGLAQPVLIAADARQAPLPDARFDRILLDVPCSGTGVLSKYPEGRFTKNTTLIDELAEIQRDCLREAWRLLRPGGLLCYSTCSILPGENQEQIRWFLNAFANARLRNLPPDMRRLDANDRCMLESALRSQSLGCFVDPAGADIDGFWYSILVKVSSDGA